MRYIGYFSWLLLITKAYQTLHCILTILSGDSWSNIGFNLTDVQPSSSSPFGNPIGNYTAADVATNGARWPVYLTSTYNTSLLETYCLARTGGVIDSSITPHGSDFVRQVNTDFLPTYGNASSGNWSAGSTLFLAFFGVNDVNLVLPMANSTQNQTLDKIFASYKNTLERVRLILDPSNHLNHCAFAYHNILLALPSRRSQLCAAERAAHGSCSERSCWPWTNYIQRKSFLR